jgi:large subunit ribosomal protein L10
MALTRSEKQSELERLETVFQGAESAILLDYRGLNVPQVTELRRQVRAARGQYRVVKNTLARRALRGTRFEPLEPFLEGATAVAYTESDAVALAKALTTFGKTAQALAIKAAVVQGRAVNG